MRKFFLLIWILNCGLNVFSQKTTSLPDRLKVYMDCGYSDCDMNFIRTEINLVDFMLDRLAADVHILVTEQETGSGGDMYQLIFFGQHQFRNMTDTLRYSVEANATDFEERDLMLKYLKLGLSPFVAKTKKAADVTIQMKLAEGNLKKDSLPQVVNDPWKYWVYRAGVNGNISADEVYKSLRFSGRISASKVTDEIKLSIELYGSKNKTVFTIDDNGIEEKIKINNDDYGIGHYLIKSLNGHWSWGYEVGFSSNTFSNNKSTVAFRTGFEYAIIPYKEVNTKYFTVSYLVGMQKNVYYDTTLYEKTKETLYTHGVETNLRFKQKWGSISFGAEYRNYLHNWKFFNLGLDMEIDIRITGGLSFNIYSFAGLTRDQLFLPKGGATPEEVYTRRRQLASGYNVYTDFGINYRFGSKLNNFVNPRFD